jgi:hypothetical protein
MTALARNFANMEQQDNRACHFCSLQDQPVNPLKSKYIATIKPRIQRAYQVRENTVDTYKNALL